jgi:hypothetical protein
MAGEFDSDVLMAVEVTVLLAGSYKFLIVRATKSLKPIVAVTKRPWAHLIGEAGAGLPTAYTNHEHSHPVCVRQVYFEQKTQARRGWPCLLLPLRQAGVLSEQHLPGLQYPSRL